MKYRVESFDTVREFDTREEAEKYFADPVADWTVDNQFTLYDELWNELDYKFVPAA